MIGVIHSFRPGTQRCFGQDLQMPENLDRILTSHNFGFVSGRRRANPKSSGIVVTSDLTSYFRGT